MEKAQWVVIKAQEGGDGVQEGTFYSFDEAVDYIRDQIGEYFDDPECACDGGSAFNAGPEEGCEYYCIDPTRDNPLYDEDNV